MLNIPGLVRARTRLHRHHQDRAKATGEVGVDEDAEDEVQAKDSNQQEVVV